MSNIRLPKLELYDSLLHHTHVSDFMTTPPIVITKDATMGDAKVIMRDNEVSGISIVDEEGHLAGLISIENIIIALDNHQMEERVEDHMVKDVITLTDTMDVNTAVEYLMGYSYGRYPVIDENNIVVGMVKNMDLISHILERVGTVYMHNKRRDEILMPSKYLINSEAVSADQDFTYRIDTSDSEQAGEGSQLFKKLLIKRNLPSSIIRRATIALYEAEVNVVIHANGKGEIKAYFKDEHLFILVSDEGPGIDNIKLAMEPGYSTAVDAIREKGWGAGMGLANIKKYTDKVIILSSENGVKMEMVILTTE